MFELRPISDLVIVAMGESCFRWPAMMAEQPAYEGEVWTVNAGALSFRHTMVFDMHSEEWIEAIPEPMRGRVRARRERLKTHDRPVMMPKALPEFPTSIAYPLEQVMELTKSDYFTNGVAFMLALALVCGVERLGLFGVDYTARLPQDAVFLETGRACVEFWLGRLVQQGCNVMAPDSSPIIGSNRVGTVYGYYRKD